ncbi:MAG: M28 family peptidase [Candidatus Heimdallarchaeota archaeon]|nr:M28 family peptidase [Candidatus Heimdallarchaeota archaeon]
MVINSVIKNVQAENLYKHVLETEGIRHPLETLEKLEETAQYLLTLFENIGLVTREHFFEVEGFNYSFRNIEGLLDFDKEQELIICAHYDTIAECLGANDNSSALAVMLEAARLLAKQEQHDYNIRFIGFCLEEENPSRVLKEQELGKKFGILDENNRFATLRAQKIMEEHFDLRAEVFSDDKTLSESWDIATKQLRPKLSDQELQYFLALQEIYGQDTAISWIGNSITLGSYAYVQALPQDKQQISGVFNLESVGYASNQYNSQTFPDWVDLSMFPSNKLNSDLLIGNFIGVFSDSNSYHIAKLFCDQCNLEVIDLPHLLWHYPSSFDKIAYEMPDMLRSDHAPFWKINVPAIMICDTLDFRYPYYHTKADTIDKLNFDFMTKVCQATIASVMAFSKID